MVKWLQLVKQLVLKKTRRRQVLDILLGQKLADLAPMEAIKDTKRSIGDKENNFTVSLNRPKAGFLPAFFKMK